MTLIVATLRITPEILSLIAEIDEQNPNLYAAGEWELVRRGAGPAPAGPTLAPGRLVGDWVFVTQDSGSLCRLTLTNRFDGRFGAFAVTAEPPQRFGGAGGQRVTQIDLGERRPGQRHLGLGRFWPSGWLIP